MGCGSSSVPNTEEEEGVSGLKVAQYDVKMTYDDDSDNDFDSIVPSTQHKQTVGEDAGRADTELHPPPPPPPPPQQQQQQQQQCSKQDSNKEISEQGNSGDIVNINMTTSRPGFVHLIYDEPDSDDDSDYYESAGEEDSDDEDLEAVQEQILSSSFSSLHSMLSYKLQSRSGDTSTPTEEVEACNDAIKQSFRNLLQCDSFCKSRSSDTTELEENAHRLQKANILKQSVRHMMMFNAFDDKSKGMGTDDLHVSPGGEVNSPSSVQSGNTSWSRGPEISINNMMSFRSISDLGSDSWSADDEATAMELSLNALLTFRSTALLLREQAKKFRAELRKMSFDSHLTCKYTTSYIRYKINKIIGLNSALSKFANENALSILNPFADKNALTASFNVHLQGLLKCIKKTNLDRINVTGPLSRSACVGLVAIYGLIAELSPSTPEIVTISSSIHLKISQFDARETSGSKLSSP